MHLYKLLCSEIDATFIAQTATCGFADCEAEVIGGLGRTLRLQLPNNYNNLLRSNSPEVIADVLSKVEVCKVHVALDGNRYSNRHCSVI